MQFTVTAEEEKKIKKFREDQNKIAKEKNLRYKVSADITYCFAHGGIGLTFYVVHNATGEELDLTDVSSW